MFNDRDLYVLGAGGLLALLCLLPSWPFAWKVGLALAIMVAALVLALARLGPDRRTLEQQLFYFLKYRLRPKHYSFWGREHADAPRGAAARGQADVSPLFSLAWDDTNIYFLMTVWLAVIGTYFTVWLGAHGDLELAASFRQLTSWR